MRSFIVLTNAGIADIAGRRAQAMRRRRELREKVINLASVVEKLTKMGRRRCCVCQSSVVIKSDPTGILERDHLE
jgi:hypothetical protein